MVNLYEVLGCLFFGGSFQRRCLFFQRKQKRQSKPGREEVAIPRGWLCVFLLTGATIGWRKKEVPGKKILDARI